MIWDLNGLKQQDKKCYFRKTREKKIYVSLLTSCNNFADNFILHPGNGYKIYMDIMTGEKLLSIQVAISLVVYWSVHTSSRGEGVGQVSPY